MDWSERIGRRIKLRDLHILLTDDLLDYWRKREGSRECGSIRPASIFERSRMSLIKASRCRLAPSTRSSGSVSCFNASASSVTSRSRR